MLFFYVECSHCQSSKECLCEHSRMSGCFLNMQQSGLKIPMGGQFFEKFFFSPATSHHFFPFFLVFFVAF